MVQAGVVYPPGCVRPLNVLAGRAFTKSDYRKIIKCLHPDRREAVTAEELNEAQRLFSEAGMLPHTEIGDDDVAFDAHEQRRSSSAR